ncbi:hypothetical protein POSPLADRAFT_1058424 [Postia placenta MAD-698-R-SB12]|uniref:Rpr2-domain-containing protein n=1 Tax=Postia placenta MAD-698-R-SB12 TaxID=670580 RepID=A0A1X6MVI0_9APHY|nr:hypothetical protein POSPLADRAFT_1058424 [Postia placenta MAD-698-R-SB12]OSX60250.1 hypothetical protein POSPLADRAFT_1058424 [Postia placenta MAD-698-R-SB12]
MQAAGVATAKFQLAVPFVLLQASPGLAALHASRARTLHPSEPALRTTHCPSCGITFLDGGGHIRSVRLSKRRKGAKRQDCTRALRMSCGACGHQQDLPIESKSSLLSPQPRNRKRQASDAKKAPLSGTTSTKSVYIPQGAVDRHPTDRTASSPVRSSVPSQARPASLQNTTMLPSSSSVTATPPRPKARSKRTTGLQGLLARNREKQAEGKKSSDLGLSSFLQELE